MRFCRPLVLTACLVAQVNGRVGSRLWTRADADADSDAVTPPTCALTCLATIIPQYCDLTKDPTCVCTNTQLTAAIQPCVLNACSIPDSLIVQKYAAVNCKVKNDKSRQQEQLHTLYVLPALATTFVITRVSIRIKLDVGLGIDDWMMVSAVSAYLCGLGTALAMSAQGFGQHTFWLTTVQLTEALRYFYINELLYIIAITLTKLSLLLFFRRIFPSRQFRFWVWIAIGFVITSNFSLFMALCLQCLPFDGNWTNWMYKVPPVKCINTFAVVYVAAAMSIIHDLLILAMPIPVLWKLNLGWQKKANLLVMFSVGSFVVLCSLLRLPSLKKLNTSSDPSFDQVPIALWTNLEMGVGIICGCLPACRSLIGYLFPSFKMSLGGDNSTNTPAYLNRSRSMANGDHKRMDTSNRTFMELDDLQGSEDELHNKNVDTGSIATLGSEAPTTHNLVPATGKGLGNRSRVKVGDVESQHQRGDGSRDIVMTKTVEQSHSPF